MASLHCSTHTSCVWLGRKQPVLTLHRCQPLRSRPSAFNARHVQRKQLARAAEVSSHARKAQVSCNAAQSEASIDQDTDLIGEDAAYFDVKQQTTKKWTLFTALLVGVLGLIYVVSYCSTFTHAQSTNLLSTKGQQTSNIMDTLTQTWVDPDTGIANNFLDVLKSISSNTEVVMLLILAVFAASHSGLAYLRPWGEDLIGAKAYRVIFAFTSLPLAALALVYFINHRYSGTPLWNLRGVPGVHAATWLLSFISFYFLYPSTFNILEVAAVDEPQVHLWETGITRITRHPQNTGQLIWCLAHLLWMGNSFVLTTSAALVAHHAFACYHGDFRLERKHGKAFHAVKARTSIVPFQAILEGRQKLPVDYYKEFLRLPYVTITVLALGVYWAHPLMQTASHYVGW